MCTDMCTHMCTDVCVDMCRDVALGLADLDERVERYVIRHDLGPADGAEKDGVMALQRYSRYREPSASPTACAEHKGIDVQVRFGTTSRRYFQRCVA